MARRMRGCVALWIVLGSAVLLAGRAGAGIATLGFWSFEETSTAQPAEDASGHEVDGVYSAGANPNVPGAPGFDSGVSVTTSDYVNVGTSPQLSALRNNYTIEAWVNPTSVAGVQRVVANTGFGFGINNGNLRFTTFGVLDYNLTLATPIPTGSWTKVAVSLDANNDANFFVDGAPVGKVRHTAPGNASSSDVFLGNRSAGTAEGFAGMLDEVRITRGARPLEVLRYSYDEGDSLANITDDSGATNHASARAQASFSTDVPSAVFDLSDPGTRSFAPGGGSSPGGATTTNTNLITNANIAANGGYTLETYIKLDGPAGLQKVIDLEGYDALRVASGSTNVYFTPQGTQYNIGTGRWAHVAGVFDSDANQARFYVDGNLIGTSAATLPRSMDSLNRGIGIGSHPTSFGETVNGKLAETRVSLGALAPRNFRMSPTLVRLGFDSNDTLPAILDTSDRWNHATASGGAILDPNIPLRGGIIGAGDRSFRPGSGGVATTNNNNLLTNANIATFGGYTLETWIYLEGTSGSAQKIIDLEGYDNLRINPGTTDVSFNVAGTGINFDIGLNRWHHVAGVLDLDAATNPTQALASLYVDGLLIGSAITTANRNMDLLNRPIGFGNHPLGGGEWVNGLLFEPRVSLGALSPDQFLTGVPEPGTMTLLALGGLALLRRRRRRRHVAMLMAAALLVAVCHTASAGPIPPRPDSGWLLDEGAGAALAEWNGFRTGVLGGPALPAWSPDTPFAYAGNTSLAFTASGAQPTLGNYAQLQGHWSGTQGTVAFWVKDENGGAPAYTLDASSGRTLMYRQGAAPGGAFAIYINGNNTGSVPGTLVPGPAGGWTHVAITWDNSLATDKVKIYQNGTTPPFATKNTSIANTVSPASVFLGSRLNQTETWGGKIDEYALWNQALPLDQVAWLATNSLSTIPNALPSNPAKAWLFNEGSGTTAQPYFGTGNGTLNGNVGWTSNSPGRHGSGTALDYDGTNGSRTTFAGLTFGTQGSIHVWAYADWDVTQGGWRYLMDASNGARTLLAHNGNPDGWSLYMNNLSVGTMTGLIPEGEWTEIVITWDNSLPYEKQKVYKNGDLFATFNATLSPSVPALLSLGSQFTGNEAWLGDIDDFGIWDYALSLDEVEWLFDHSIATLPEPGTLSLLAVGALALLRRRRRRIVAMLMAAALLVAVCHTASAGPIPPRPDSGWLLDEGSGAALAEWNGFRTGVLGGPALPTWSADTPFAYAGNTSLAFAASGSAPTLGNYAQLQGHWSGTQGTVAFWVKDENGGAPAYTLDANTGRTLMYRQGAAPAGVFGLYINGTSTGTVAGSLVPGPTGDWTHVAITWDNSLATDKIKIYQNGSVFDKKNTTIANTVSPASVFLGSRLSQTETWGGKIDEYALWNQALPLDQVAWLATNSLSTVPAAQPVLPSTVWFLDEGAGSTTSPTYGTGTGTLQDEMGWTTNGAHGNALWSDGTQTNRAELTGHDLGTEGSIQLWVYRDTTDTAARYVMDTDGNRTLLYNSGTGWSLHINGTSVGTADSSLIPTGEWTQLLITWDASLPYERQKIYQNGELFTTFNATVGAGVNSLIYLGCRQSLNENWLGGLDELAIWDHALTQAEAEWLFETGLHTLPEPGTLSLLAVGALALLRRRRNLSI